MARTDYYGIQTPVLQATSQAIRTVNGTVGTIAPEDYANLISAMHSQSDYDNVMAQLVEETVSGSIASFTDGANNLPVKEIVCQINPTETGTGAKSPSNPYVIGGFTGININAVDFNQLVKNGNFVDKSNWTESGITWSVADNVATVTPTEYQGRLRQTIVVQANHIYLRFCNFKGENGVNYTFNGLFNNVYGTGNWQSLSQITKETTNGSRYYQFRSEETSNFHNFYIKNVIYFDLTQMFGENVANYLYALEQGQAGAGVAVFKRMFYKDYYAYTTGGTVQYIKDINGDNYPYAHADFGQTVYGGEFVAKEGEFDTIEPTWGDKIDLGSLNWAYQSDAQRFMASNAPNIKNTVEARTLNFACEIFTVISDGRAGSAVPDKCIYTAAGTNLYARDFDYTDATAFKAAVSGKYICYPLETLPDPITLPTKTEVKTLLGANNLYHDCNGNIEVGYRANGALYVAQH